MGAGVMGTAIGAAAVACGFDVLVTDANEAIRRRAAENIVNRAKQDYDSASGSVEIVEGLSAIAACPIVIEAVVEDRVKKGALLRELDERMPAESLLATNTSTIPIARLGEGLRNPERLCGMHFFLPLRERPAIEVIGSQRTSAEARTKALRCAGALGRDVLLAPDAVGFIVNRMMMPYVSEAMQLLAEGVDAETIERVAVGFGMPTGPLSLLDEIGLDTALDCGWVFSGAYEERIAVSPLLVAMVKAGRLGKKSGAGFFRYAAEADGGVSQQVDPASAGIVARWSKTPADAWAVATADDIVARLFAPMVFEGARLLEEHDTSLPGDIDLGAVLGLGMSASRGGPLYWCDRIGARRLLEMTEPLRGLGERMTPPEGLRRMAENGTGFHGGPVGAKCAGPAAGG
ncbi:MAG: 3-hydroxyacyl-CoA dehydrogenase [Thermoguttaceae bacterium]